MTVLTLFASFNPPVLCKYMSSAPRCLVFVTGQTFAANLRGNENYSRELSRPKLRKKRRPDPWEMEDKDDSNDWEVEEEEIIDFFYWEDGDDLEEAAAAVEKQFAEFEAAVSALSDTDIAMSDTSVTTGTSSSAAIASVSTWFLLVTVPIWYLN
ncbi:hypothetical protein QTG54_003945 [Skeletonema marinoi]|uniref:Uncharacterized protein n=1 Tax=Skeletonema marinoi TaxID=267567 RepID=A0AAD9DFP7_9STRA|nr:hypothetical protein QTG54_003945 [Skeletonema marinoi]